MKSLAKLIYKTYISNLPTAFPVYFYGMPNGKVYLIYSRFYDVKFGKSGLEFVFAIHKEFSYDYEKEEVLSSGKFRKKTSIFAESIDKPNPEIHIIKITRDINSYSEALSVLNKEVQK